jgi:hypothetical protein
LSEVLLGFLLLTPLLVLAKVPALAKLEVFPAAVELTDAARPTVSDSAGDL